VWDGGYYRTSVNQYGLWMSRLISQFGNPEVPIEELAGSSHIVPPCRWRLAPVTIKLSYSWMRGEDCFELSVKHDAFSA
jgi:hypothetical protein